MLTSRISARAARTFGLTLAAALLLLPTLAFTAPAPRGDLRVDGAWARASLAGTTTSAAYFTVTNGGKTADRLLSVSTAAAAQAQIHQMSNSGGTMRMAQVQGGLAIPAGGSVRLAPGGLHVMLMGVRTPLKPGVVIKLTLRFQNAGTVTVDAPVRAADPMAGMHH